MDSSIFDVCGNREVRVFISSTFNDMMQERELIVKRIFPELRAKFADRGVSITEIDLRWGIPEEESEGGKVIQICLNEIDKSRPYFIGLLGERYGWIPEVEEYENHKKIIEDYSWVKDDIDSGLSITEMEIQYGVLRNANMKKRAHFYLRNKNLGASTQFKEENGSKEEEKLKTLKNEIISDNEISYKDYNSFDELCEQITEDLSSIIENDFPHLEENEKKLLPQLNFVNSRRKIYFRNEAYFEKINNHIQNKQTPIIVTGELGYGKSALLANFLTEYIQKNPENICLFNFSGADPDASNHIKVLQRFCEELSGRSIDIKEEFPTDPAGHMITYLLNLVREKEEQKVLLLIDGLDEINSAKDAHLLNWLPDVFPENLSIIYSTGSNKIITRLNNLDYEKEILKIEKLEKEFKKHFIIDYLNLFSKKLSVKLTDKIAADSFTDTPLILKSFLDEVRLFGVHEKLEEWVDHYLTAADATDYYGLVLNRLEEDFDADDKKIVESVLTALALLKNGIREIHIQKMLNLPTLEWVLIYNSIETNLQNQNGYLRISNEYFKAAIEKKYLQDIAIENKVRTKIADYFKEIEKDVAEVDELAHQFLKVKNNEGLYDFLSDINTVLFLNDNYYELIEYWSRIAPVYLPSEAYTPNALMNFFNEEIEPETRCGVISLVATVLTKLNAEEAALNLYKLSYEISEKQISSDARYNRSNLTRLTESYIKLNRLAEAEECALKNIELCEKYCNEKEIDTASSYFDLAKIYYGQGHFEKSVEVLQKTIGMLDFEGDYVGFYLDVLKQVAVNQFHMIDFENAIEYYIEVLGMFIELYGVFSLEILEYANDIGKRYYEKNQYENAFSFFEQALKISKEIYGKKHSVSKSIENDFIKTKLKLKEITA